MSQSKWTAQWIVFFNELQKKINDTFPKDKMITTWEAGYISKYIGDIETYVKEGKLNEAYLKTLDIIDFCIRLKKELKDSKRLPNTKSSEIDQLTLEVTNLAKNFKAIFNLFDIKLTFTMYGNQEAIHKTI